uniref:PLD phosphodiesterase domain-containing protein n=1 Tax=Bionectria ochroleuca TaxID=29856 RepID=A0A8H7KEB2_BIOOC
MENMVFLIDLPRLGDAADHKPTQFSTELARFLTEAKVDDRMVDSLTSYDFSRTERLGFVYSIPGSHTNDLRRRTGYCGLGNVVSSLGLATTSPIEVDSVSASLGSLTSDLITSIYNACQGDNGMKEYNARGTRKPAGASHSTPQLLRDHFRIYFPTEATVVNTRGGRGAAGTICVQAKWWRQPRFPTDLVRDCVSSRKGLLLHTKAIFVHSSSAAEVADAPSHKASAWAYVGSANLSESAWGRLVKDSKTGKPKLNCRNWECGVVVPVLEANGKARPTTKGAAAVATSSAGTEAGSRGSSNLGELFASTVPMPMLVPGRLYGPNEEPWFYADS